MRTFLPRPGRIVLALLLSLPLALQVASSQARERLLWLVQDLPPFTIFEGPQSGQGVVDHLLPRLIERLPEYDHSVIRVNRARGLQMLQDKTFACDPALLWTPERARYIHFSKPFLKVVSSGLVLRRQDRLLVEPFLRGSQVDLSRLMTEIHLKLGIVARRSYSAQVDHILRGLPEDSVSRHYGNDATASLLQMQALGRVQLVLGYWPEIGYLIQRQGGSLDTYMFYPVSGVAPYQFMHVGCSDTALGREALEHIDRVLPSLRRAGLRERYARWLPPKQRAHYLERAAYLIEEKAEEPSITVPDRQKETPAAGEDDRG
ncbi:TIGR02285 family protein [Pseudomonas capeferrum]|uniref:TIGR02285 family protein n=1 Tax=Pseudomonas capeferrum TaxID=1495066 RepID=UPI0015E461BE|nr:TIGR02285 family protein [Pseudomonas capeferrum]MBA1203727.1 TIGR02285 family protein [Pseudomonas capeferrum]